jgi:hypothetical protein
MRRFIRCGVFFLEGEPARLIEQCSSPMKQARFTEAGLLT